MHRAPVVGIAQRTGKLATGDASKASILPVIQSELLPKSLIYTQEWIAYDDLRRNGQQHKRIAHAEKVYVVGNIHTNTIEVFWSLLKRGIAGVYHSCSVKHLQAR